MKLALEALENASPAAWASRVDSDTMKSIWRKHADAMEGLQVLLAELGNASCKSAQKRLEAQQPSSKEHLFELWWEAHMPNATQEQAWTAFTAAVASNGVGIAAQQPAKPEPAGYLYDFKYDDEMVRDWFTQNIDEIQFRPATCLNIRPLYAHQAPSVPKDDQIAALVNKVRDIARMFHDHQSLRERIAIELVPALKASQEVKSNAERWRYAIADGGNQSMNFMDIFDDWDGDGDFVEVFDDAMLAAKKASA